MRILVGSAYFESHRGGIEVVAGRLAREFRRTGDSVAWMAADATSPPACNSVCDRAVPLRAFNGTERWFGIPLPVPGFGALRKIRQQVARADVVHLHDALYPANIAAFVLARLAGKPVVLTQHIATVPYRHPLPRSIMRAMNLLLTGPMLADANQAVFISNVTAEAFANIRYRGPSRIIFNGVDTDLFRPAADASERALARKQFGLSTDRPIALFVGRFVEKKGLTVLRQAAAVGAEIDWVLAGWGKLDPTQWGLPNVFVRSGLDQASLAPLYRASDVFVLPSTGEGFPLVLQEALVSGLPSVCSAETAQADDRLAGLVRPVVLDAENPAASANTVLEAVRGAIAQNTLEEAAEGTDLMRAWYSWSRTAAAYQELFRRVVGEAAAHEAASARGRDRAMSGVAPEQIERENAFVPSVAERTGNTLTTRADLRYLAVAASCAAGYNTTMIAGDLAGLHYLQSSVISFVLIGLWGYALHAHFTFRESMSLRSLVRYTAAMAANFPLSIALLFALCDLMGLAVAIAAPVTTMALFAWNFIASRWAITGKLLLPRGIC